MAWMDESTKGIPNKYIAGVGGVLLLAAGFAGMALTPTPPAPPARVRTGAALPDAGLLVGASSAEGRDVDAAASGPVTLTLAELHRSVNGTLTNEYDGRNICTCGFVQSSGSSPDHSVDGTPLNVIHTVYVSELSRAPRDDESPAVAVCTWVEGARPKVKEGQKVCAQGEYSGPTIKKCAIVSKCP